MRNRTLCPAKRLFPLIRLFLLCAALTGAALPAHAASFQPDEVSAKQTVELYQNIPGLSSQQLEYGKGAIRKMNYNSQRIFRKICGMQGVSFERAQEAAELLGRERFTYEQVQAFEAFAGINSAVDIKLGLAGLEAVKSLSYASSKSFRSYVTVSGVSASQALSTISMLNNMDEVHNKAAQALFAVNNMHIDAATKGVSLLLRLRGNQAKAAETYAKTTDMDPETVLDGLELLQKLHQDDAWNARCLFTNKAINGKAAWNWLVAYFALPTDIQEAQYARLDSHQKSVLLKGLYDGGEEIIWKINNLHAVTDQNGYEISAAELGSYSKQMLQNKFDQLAPAVRSRFGGQFASAGQGQAVGLLRTATSAARVQTARDLATADIYAVMAQGSELYDSSFREILVPVLQERIKAKNQGDLLAFLQTVDPENQLVSDFIVSCAQKGKLTAFFPSDSGKQQEILKLVASSAFRDEDSILLFSATLSHLLKMLEPGARTYLITMMAQKAETEQAVFAKLISVILQYYLQTYPELLGPADRNLLSRLLVRQGAINLEKYQLTPFSEWKQDGRVGSVSMYHPDDDGRQSFVSNGNLLLKSGYRLAASKQYTPGTASPALEQEVQRYGSSGLAALFQQMRHRHFAVAFIKQVGGVTICHTQFVYSDKENQMEMLRRFIQSKDEMLAQRGHSYWRSEQIVEPLEELIKENKISQEDLRGKQRFLSLGSCGGVKAYTNLTRLFAGSVDILATIGTGLALINDPYNKSFFEIIAETPASISWKGVAQKTAFIFQGDRGQDYLLPGSLTAILHKILDESQQGTGIAKDGLMNRRRS